MGLGVRFRVYRRRRHMLDLHLHLGGKVSRASWASHQVGVPAPQMPRTPGGGHGFTTVVYGWLQGLSGTMGVYDCGVWLASGAIRHHGGLRLWCMAGFRGSQAPWGFTTVVYGWLQGLSSTKAGSPRPSGTMAGSLKPLGLHGFRFWRSGRPKPSGQHGLMVMGIRVQAALDSNKKPAQ